MTADKEDGRMPRMVLNRTLYLTANPELPRSGEVDSGSSVNVPLDRQMVELELARLRSHEIHMRWIYGLRLGGLGIAALTISIGAVMIFLGLQGSFDWAVGDPKTLSAKLTNASPGIVFATVGLIISVLTLMQQPVGYSTGPTGEQHVGPKAGRN